MELREIELEDVFPDEKNPRKDFGDIAALAESCMLNAINPGEPVNPIVVVEDGGIYRIVDGERRYKAMAKNKLKRCHAVVCEDLDEANSMVAMVATDDKQQLSEIERSRGVQQMLLLGVDPERIERVGVSAVFVKPGQYLQAVPREMIDAAERLKLPLFSLPEDISYMNCIVPIFEQLTNRQLMLLRRTESIYAQLMQTIVRQEGLDGICETLHSVTGQEIVILSASGKQILAKCVGEYGDAELDEDQL